MRTLLTVEKMLVEMWKFFPMRIPPKHWSTEQENPICGPVTCSFCSTMAPTGSWAKDLGIKAATVTSCGH